MTAVVTPTDLFVLVEQSRGETYERIKQLSREVSYLLEILQYQTPEAPDIYPKISYLWEEADRMRDAYIRWVALEEAAR